MREERRNTEFHVKRHAAGTQRVQITLSFIPGNLNAASYTANALQAIRN
jgi:hypothetical protein